MLEAMVLRGALSAFSTMFGSLGVFFTYFSFLVPAVGAHALLFLTAATAIAYSTPES